MGGVIPQGHSVLTGCFCMVLRLFLISVLNKLTCLYRLGRLLSRQTCWLYVSLVLQTTTLTSPTSASTVLPSLCTKYQPGPLLSVANCAHVQQQGVLSTSWSRFAPNPSVSTETFSDLILHLDLVREHVSKNRSQLTSRSSKSLPTAVCGGNRSSLLASTHTSKNQFFSSGYPPCHLRCACFLSFGRSVLGACSGRQDHLPCLQLSRHIIGSLSGNWDRQTPSVAKASSLVCTGRSLEGDSEWFVAAPFRVTRSGPKATRNSFVLPSKSAFPPHPEDGGDRTRRVRDWEDGSMNSLAAMRRQNQQLCPLEATTPSSISRRQPGICRAALGKATGNVGHGWIELRNGERRDENGDDSTGHSTSCIRGAREEKNKNERQEDTSASDPRPHPEQHAPQPSFGNYHEHVPVMVQEVLQYLITAKDGVYVDCTAGGGGHVEAIWRAVASEGGRLLAIDRDEEAVEATRNRLRQLQAREGCDLGDTTCTNPREDKVVHGTESAKTDPGSSSVEKQVHVSRHFPPHRNGSSFERQQGRMMGTEGRGAFGKGTPAERPSVIVLQSSFADLPHALRRAMNTWQGSPGTVQAFSEAALPRRRTHGKSASQALRDSRQAAESGKGNKRPSKEDGPASRAGTGEKREKLHTKLDLQAPQEPAQCSYGDPPEVAALYEGLQGTVDGIFADLGVSTHQLNAAHRGFSHSIPGPLDMRFGRDKSSACGAVASPTSCPNGVDNADESCIAADETALHGRLQRGAVTQGGAPRNAASSDSCLENTFSDICVSGPGGALDAAQVVNGLPQAALASIFKLYGEEPLAELIAACIVRHRETRGTLRATEELREIVEGCCRYRNPQFIIKTCSRVFQMYVNQELEVLDLLLTHAERLLKPGGRLVILSYHSLEDRLIKQRLKRITQGSGWTAANSCRRGFFSSRHRPTGADTPGEFGSVTSAERGPKSAEMHQQLSRFLGTVLSDAVFAQEAAKSGSFLDADEAQRALFGLSGTRTDAENKVWHLLLKKPLKPKEEEVLRNRRARSAKMRVAAKLPYSQVQIMQRP
ncbi:putative S-adenosyl-methyltransferase mraW [Neospora caninum Liverpool]|uniref:Putative S-adenosyl-methyltransferase mraW n=1 Tax=Neospora caninum (strain Liverpool) TaxID=572307 RepID=F0VL65_NEOCL|nr:putative S-adenosyl-methyltransferase mraW [Neospora caninum Liverpool]CBZ54817.1 putative S-adenosyl-methyltransferase mraW [Neospora caninum Liverpool]|eukprot:XP_003884845.1 putative S-adenosyl-methyltransferase mraW [Neospora caninum Liverpool]